MSEAIITTEASQQAAAVAPAGETPAPVPIAPAATDEAVAAAEGDKPTDGEQVKPERPPRTFTQEELERILGKERAKAERRAERFGYERAMREAAERQLTERTAPAPQQQPTGDGKPTPDKFQSYDEYTEALTDWKVRQALDGVGARARQAQEETEARQQAAKVVEALRPAVEKYEDFEEVALRDDLPVTQVMGEAILDLGTVGHDVLYFLGQHPKEASRIAGLTSPQQVRELDKIAATLASPPKPTQAPAPVAPLAGTATVEKRLEEASYDEYVKIRRRQRAQR